MPKDKEIIVEPLGTRTKLWKDFVETSSNGTLFHHPDFLAYHPEDRFNSHHLVFFNEGEPVAILPAAIVCDTAGRRILKSPYGASVGGPILRRKHSLDEVIRVVAALKHYAATEAVEAIEMRIGPPFYCEPFSQTLDFALAAQGFRLDQRWLTHTVALPSDAARVTEAFGRRRHRRVGAARRKGVTVRLSQPEGRREDLSLFYQVLTEDRRKFNATPTHSEEELERLFELVPDRLGLFLCEADGEVIGGNLVFELTPRVANSFYPCHDSDSEAYFPALVVSASVAEHYAQRGFLWLELGPTTFDDYSFNAGLAWFKEGVGGIGFCRDAWLYEV